MMLKADQVYEYVKEKILSNELRPGEPIRIEKVAQELGVSKTPVREALKRLVATGLIEARPNAGVRVARPNLDELEQVFLVRRELEKLATRLAVKHIDPPTIDRLRQLADAMETAHRSGDTRLYGRLNKEFHSTIYHSCGAETLTRLIDELWDRSEWSRLVFQVLPGRFEQSSREHRQLIDALERRDVETAAAIIDKQKTDGFFPLLAVLKEYDKIQRGADKGEE